MLYELDRWLAIQLAPRQAAQQTYTHMHKCMLNAPRRTQPCKNPDFLISRLLGPAVTLSKTDPTTHSPRLFIGLYDKPKEQISIHQRSLLAC